MPIKATGKATVGTVAKRARVAPTTVSRVLNGGYVSADARARVEKAIRDLDYVPSSTARSLKYGRRGCIGIVVESVHGPWFMGLFAGAETELAKKRISVMLGGLRLGQNYDASVVASWISERRIDGLIFARYTAKERPLLEAAREAQIPMSFICPDEVIDAGFTVRCRNFDAGRAIGGHLAELGHRRIAWVGGPKSSIDSLDRMRGLKEQLEQTGITLRAEDVSFAASYEPEAGQRAALDFLKRPAGQRPSAVVLGNDAMAISFMRELLRAGVKIPDDVSVAGFDNVGEAERFWPGLTTVAQPMQTLGAAACKALLERVEKPEQDVVMTIEYPMELVPRESTGPAGARRAKGRANSE